MRPVAPAGARRIGIGACAAVLLLAVSIPTALAAGSATLYPSGVAGTRANTEWRTSTYGGGAVFRRTLLHAYATTGEYLLVGSTAIGTGSADIMVWDPGLVTGTVGREVVPTTPSYSCAAQRTRTGIAAQGKIASRAQELAGPDTVPAGVPGGYTPCYYQAPSTGIYSIAVTGPSGFSSDTDGQPATDISLSNPHNYDGTQLTSVAAWDVTVRGSLPDATTTRPGRLFTYLLSLYAGGNGHPVDIVTYVVTPDGYRYKVDDRGMDPAGWIQYANRLGFLDPDGKTPLYHDAVAKNSGQPAQLTSIQAGVLFATPEFPMFFEPPGAGDAGCAGHPPHPHRPGRQCAHLQGRRQAGRRLLQVRRHVLLHLDGQGRLPDRHQPRRRQLRPHQPAEPGASWHRHRWRPGDRLGWEGQLRRVPADQEQRLPVSRQHPRGRVPPSLRRRREQHPGGPDNHPHQPAPGCVPCRSTAGARPPSTTTVATRPPPARPWARRDRCCAG